MTFDTVMTLLGTMACTISMWLMYVEYKRASDSMLATETENIRLLKLNTSLLRNNLAFTSVNRNLGVMLNADMELFAHLRVEFEVLEHILDVHSEDVDMELLRAQCLHVAGIITASERKTKDGVESLNRELLRLVTEQAS